MSIQTSIQALSDSWFINVWLIDEEGKQLDGTFFQLPDKKYQYADQAEKKAIREFKKELKTKGIKI